MFTLIIYTFIQLINFVWYLGYSQTFFSRKTNFYLFGKRNTICIINLYWSLFLLKQTITFLQRFFLNFGFMWYFDGFYSRYKHYKKMYPLGFSVNLKIIDIPWVFGLITNFRKLIRFRQQQQLLRFPNTFWIQHNMSSFSIINEGLKLQLPIITICDSNAMNLNKITYWLPGNEKSELTKWFCRAIVIKLLSKINYLRTLYFMHHVFDILLTIKTQNKIINYKTNV
jgi:ribosomal protein S2